MVMSILLTETQRIMKKDKKRAPHGRLGSIDLIPVLFELFGAIERVVRPSEQVLKRLRGFEEGCTADAAGDVFAAVRDAELAQLLLNLDALVLKRSLADGALDEHDELVAAKAADQIARAEHAGQEFADGAEQAVARIVAEVVVDRP